MTDVESRFEELFRANYGDVFGYALRRCKSQQDAEDLTAETFAVAWRRIDDIPDGEGVRPWLFGAARRIRLNQERTHRRQRTLVDQLGDLLLVFRDRDSFHESPYAGSILDALRALSDRDREVLQLHVWEDLSADEIAVVLDISTAAVWKRLQRARQRLSVALARPTEGPSVHLAVENNVIKEETP